MFVHNPSVCMCVTKYNNVLLYHSKAKVIQKERGKTEIRKEIEKEMNYEI